jgi:hypothetical protein
MGSIPGEAALTPVVRFRTQPDRLPFKLTPIAANKRVQLPDLVEYPDPADWCRGNASADQAQSGD